MAMNTDIYRGYAAEEKKKTVKLRIELTNTNQAPSVIDPGLVEMNEGDSSFQLHLDYKDDDECQSNPGRGVTKTMSWNM